MNTALMVLILTCSILRAETISDLMGHGIPGCYYADGSKGQNILQITADGSTFLVHEEYPGKFYHVPELPDLTDLQKKGITTADIRKKLGIEHKSHPHVGYATKLSWSYFSIKDNELTILSVGAYQDWNYKISDVKSYVKCFKLSDFPEFGIADEAMQKKILNLNARDPQFKSDETGIFPENVFTIIFETDESIPADDADFQNDLVFMQDYKVYLLKVLRACDAICAKSGCQRKSPTVLFKMNNTRKSTIPDREYNRNRAVDSEVKKTKSTKEIKVIFTRDEKILGGSRHRFDIDRNCIFMHPRNPINSLAHNLGHAAGYVGRFDECHSEDYNNLMAPFDYPNSPGNNVDEQYATKVIKLLNK